MNRVYKVIWSKAKHCYVVTSEIARSVTKSASSARSAGRKGAAVLAMAALLFTAGGVLGEAANVTDITVNDKGNVITVTKDVGDPTPITIDNVAYATEAGYAKEATKAYGDGDGLVIKNTYAKKADVEKNLSDLDEKINANTVAVAGVVEAGEKVGEKLLDLDKQVKVNADAVAAEETARKQADQNNLKIDGDGVVSMVKDDSKPAVNKLVLNKDDQNQITLSDKGIKVGLNSGVMDKDGFYAGGDTADTAKAALKADGKIKGANGAFTVDENGNVASKATITGEKVTDGKGASMSNGTVTGGTVTSTGNISALGDIHASGNITGANASIQGALTAGSATITGGLTAGGAIQGTSISDGTATMKNGDITGVKNLSAETITTHGDLTVNGKLNMDEINMTKNGIVGDNNVTASTKVAAGEITSYKKATSTKDGSEKESAIDYDENGTSTWAKATDADGKKNKSSLTVEGKGIKSIATDGKINASTNLSNKGFNTYASDGGKNKTYTKQTAESLTSQIGDDGKVKSVMNADGITNNADGGTITNSAKDLVNTATGNMTNTVGGKLLNDVTGDMENKVGGNLTNTIGGSQTTTVTGDSSLKAENITNEAKNKITNKAIDVETDATSSIVQKVTNDAGSNTSTQWSYQTTEEMSQTDGKTASYLRGAVEEKSELIDGDVKTTIDTVAGQTNTNITDGTNTSNDLQKADQIASSVTKGTNKTVVNQNAESLASSITDGTKFNNSNNTVDKSEQQIRASDTQFSATSKTATKMEDALVSGDSVIDVMKNLDDAANPFIGSAVTDGTNITVVTQTAKDITNTAEKGTIANNAKDITNHATENMTNTVDNNLTTTVGGNETRTVKGTLTETVTGDVTEDYKANLDTKVRGNETHYVAGNQTNTVSGDRTVNVKGTETENFNAQVTNVKTDQKTSVGGNQTNIVTGNQQNTVSGSKTETVKKAVTEKYGSQATTVDGDQSTNVGGNQSNVVKGNQTNTISGNKTETVKGEVTEKYGSLTTEVKGESKLSAANITNSAKKKLSNSAADIENIASKSITDKVGENVERTMTTEQIQDKVGKTTVTTTDGLTKLTDEDHNHTTEMDYANVTKDLSVERDTTLGKKGEDTNLTVNSKSEFKDTVKMDSTLEVDRTSKFNDNVTITNNGLAVTGGTTTDKLEVKGTSEFGGKAAFKDDVSMGKNLTVTGKTETGTLHVNGDGYVGGDLNVKGNIETHDAVLSADSRQVVTGRQLYQTNERVDRLDNRIKKVGANAAALAALRPGDFNPDDKFSIAAGFGSYRNANAAALGLFYRPNENVLLSLGTSFGDGENMVNAGVSVKFGRGKSMAERRKEMADEVSSMRDEMRSQDERIAELEEMLKKQSELIEKLSKES
ncbi:MAG TPA: ESPR-type extended signal peptide-containing protein [Veillonellaceae bacterium]|nr:ESPR-type extended signal peptide-containing protein [Veillonellaceae bacterium]